MSVVDARAEMGEMNIHRNYSDERNEALIMNAWELPR